MDLEMDLMAKIDSYKDDIIRDLKRVIEVPSVSEDMTSVKKMLNLAVQIAGELGFEAKTVLDERVGVIEIGEGPETIGLLAHVDVVPPGDTAAWKTPPFVPTVEGNLMYGRGTIDDKGPLIASLYSMKALKESGQKFHKKIQLILGTQEEVDWTEMEEYVANFPLPDYGFTPDGSFPITNIEKGYTDIELLFQEDDPVGDFDLEITDLQGGSSVNSTPGEASALVKGDLGKIKDLVANYKTTEKESVTCSEENGLARIVAKGVSVHSAYPEGGNNALWTLSKLFAGQKFKLNSFGKAVKFINDLSADCFYGEKLGLLNESEYNENGEFIHKSSVVPTLTKTSEGLISVNFNIRNTSGTLRPNIDDAFGKVAGEYCFTTKITTYQDPLYVNKDKPFIKLMADVYDELSGFKNEFEISYGTSYAKAMSNIVAWGPIFPGEEDLCHMVNENVNLDNLFKAAKIYTVALKRMAFCEESFK